MPASSRPTRPTSISGSRSSVTASSSASSAVTSTTRMSAARCRRRCRARLTEIQQEGLRIPPMRLMRDGVINQDLLSLIANNVRLPEQNWGDLNAQIACVNVGERKVHEILDRFGKDEFKAGLEQPARLCREPGARGHPRHPRRRVFLRRLRRRGSGRRLSRAHCGHAEDSRRHADDRLSPAAIRNWSRRSTCRPAARSGIRLPWWAWSMRSTASTRP